MTPSERWRKAEQIYRYAVELPADEREEYLRQACGDDAELRREAENLLATCTGVGGQRIESIIQGVAAAMLGEESAPHADEGRFVPGTLLGERYRIVALLGSGGMGEVYRATDLTLGQSVALKFLPERASRDQRLLERFRDEVRLARQVSHPNVCRVYDIGDAKGTPFLTMEYVDGEDLASLLRRIGRLPAAKALEISRKICAGLAAAHDRGIIHRDLKPANIMINKLGDVVIMDFGLAAVASQVSETGARSGTPLYMAPERLRRRQATAASDIYALGLVLYEIFTGKRPFEGTTVEQLLAQQEAGVPAGMSSLAPDIDPAVERTVRRCLDPEPGRRPPGALAVAAALPGGDPLTAALAAGVTPTPEMVAAGGETTGLPLKYSAALLIFAAVGIFVNYWLREGKDPFLQAPVGYSPQALREKARDIAETFGYQKRPQDSSVWLRYRRDLIAYLDSQPQQKARKEWLAAESPVRADYWEGTARVIPRPTDPSVDPRPAPEPGLVRLSLDGGGRLREFLGIPYDRHDGLGKPVAAEEVFRAANLDPAKFTEIVPQGPPFAPTDQLRAWKGPHPALPNTELVVEMGTAKGRVTWVAVRFPWDLTPVPAGPASASILLSVVHVCYTIGLIFAAVLARRNWKLQRADRKGALLVAAVCFLCEAVSWLASVHAPFGASILPELLPELGVCLTYGMVLWILYLALEPALRSQWPHSIITWNRLLAGRWRDAQLNSHVLIGAAAGTLFAVAFRWVGVARAYQLSIFTVISTGQWISGTVSQVEVAWLFAPAMFFSVFLIRLLVRRPVPAAMLAAAMWMLVSGRTLTPLHWPVFFAIMAFLFFIVLRFGVVAQLAAIFYSNEVAFVILGSDWNAWYAPYGLATFALLVGIVVVAFWRSLGGRPLLASVP